MDKKIKEGWTWLSNSRMYHYFVGHESLCKKWGIIDNSALINEYVNPCPKCLKALEKRKSQEA